MQKKIDNLRNDLQMQVTALRPDQNTILIVCPRDNEIEVSSTYMNWLVEVLQSMIDSKVKIIVLPNNQIQIEEKRNETHTKLSDSVGKETYQIFVTLSLFRCDRAKHFLRSVDLRSSCPTVL